MENVRRVAKVTGYVACAEGFTGQPKVMKGASDLIGDPFGGKGPTPKPPSAAPSYPCVPLWKATLVIELNGELSIRTTGGAF